MKGFSIRKLKDNEMRRVLRLVVDSSNALNRKNNRKLTRIRIAAADPFMLHLKHTDPNGCVGAFENDRLVGFASSIIRENQWYLGYLFVAPGKWGKGIGRRLLARVMKTADTHQISLFSLCTFSYNPHAVALYTSFGMPVQSGILIMKWQKTGGNKLKLKSSNRKLVIEHIDDYENLGFINRLDKKNRGVARPEDHKFFIDNEASDLISFHDGRKQVGYAVLYRDGWIAPVSAIDKAYLPDLLDACIRLQLDAGCREIAVRCEGSNGDMANHILRIGLRIIDIPLLMSNKRFGNLGCYLPAHLAIF